ncbi:PQQ-binding-like beta-propeller repeat protein [Nannocystis bainbridge]|uniref:PQQ-binding-like beta-propeller repeat protein n=1 Tax=Nannocystis bainbridge TaxID=2995303 RepID=A0ABT5ECD0_9BACT|nr:PQQ-binding-like beta-propeller repeat protein [Nannocystis bainbridge]MDC0723514.1 PQQ-binding-like beta-propeller repeat protein [Nannocystis bainbridge]
MPACIENYQVGQNPAETDTAGDPGTDSDDSGPSAPATCGDGVLDADEACDDGNDDPADGCDLECRPTAVVAWTRTDRGGAELGARAVDIAVDPTGRIVVVGAEHRPSGFERAFVLVLDPAGEVVWRHTEADGVADASLFFDVEVDAGGRIFVAGNDTVEDKATSLVRGFAPTAEPLWTFRQSLPQHFGQARALALGPDALYSVSNEGQLDGTMELIVRRHDLLTGAAAWQSPHGAPMVEYGADIVVAGGRLAVVGSTFPLDGEVPHPLVASFAFDGALLASAVEAPVEGEWYGVAPIGAAGDLLLAGYVVHQGEIDRDAVLRRVDADGQELWTFFDDGPSELFQNVAVRPDETFIAAGAGRIGDAYAVYSYTRRFAGDGTTIWSSQLFDAGPNMDEMATSIALGPGFVAATGMWWEGAAKGTGGASQANFWVRRFADQ